MNNGAPTRDGDCLVITEHGQMPERCPLCNSPDVGDPIDVKFASARKPGLKGRAIAAVMDMVRNWNYTGPIVARIYFCDQHRGRRIRLIRWLAAIFILGVVALILGIALNGNRILGVKADWIGMYGMLAAVLAFVALIPTLGGTLNLWFKIRRFADRQVWVTGACPAFLEQLEAETAPTTHDTPSESL